MQYELSFRLQSKQHSIYYTFVPKSLRVK